MPSGYTQSLYILPFDHRASFMSGLFGWTGALEPEQAAKISAAKRVIYDGFTAAVADGIDKDQGRHPGVGCIVLGRGENEQHVRACLSTAAGVPGCIGFAVGRTTFWEPLIALRDKKITREAAVAEIARRYRQWVTIFEAAKTAARFADPASATQSARSLPG